MSVGAGDETMRRIAADVVDVSRSWSEPTFSQAMTSWLGAIGIALLVPFAIMLVGLPLVLAIRVAHLVSWMIAGAF